MSNQTKEVSKKLMQLNLDAFEGYETAADNANDSRITTFFNEAALERKGFAEYWAAHLDDPSYKTGLKADLHRVWIDLKTGRQKYDATSILRECQRGEKYALKKYQEISDENLEEKEAHQLKEQQKEIEAKLDQIRIMIEEFEYKDFDRNNDTPVA